MQFAHVTFTILELIVRHILILVKGIHVRTVDLVPQMVTHSRVNAQLDTVETTANMTPVTTSTVLKMENAQFQDQNFIVLVTMVMLVNDVKEKTPV